MVMTHLPSGAKTMRTAAAMGLSGLVVFVTVPTRLNGLPPCAQQATATMKQSPRIVKPRMYVLILSHSRGLWGRKEAPPIASILRISATPPSGHADRNDCYDSCS